MLPTSVPGLLLMGAGVLPSAPPLAAGRADLHDDVVVLDAAEAASQAEEVEVATQSSVPAEAEAVLQAEAEPAEAEQAEQAEKEEKEEKEAVEAEPAEQAEQAVSQQSTKATKVTAKPGMLQSTNPPLP